MSQRPFKTALLAFALLWLAPMTKEDGTAWSQTTQQSAAVGPKGVILGQMCTRRTDRFPGVIKVDACGRWYCGRVDINDITVLNPHFAEDMKCTWRLVDNKCKCRR